MNRYLGTAAAVLCLAAFTRAADVDLLVKQLKDDSSDVRRLAAKQLGEIGADARPAIPALSRAVRDDKDRFVRRFAAQSLGELGPDARAAVPALSAALKDKHSEVVEAASKALARIGPDAVSALADLLKDKKKDLATRKLGIEALGTMGKDAPPSAVSALTDALKDADLRVSAVTALGEMGPAAGSAVEPIKSLLKDNKDRAFGTAANTALKKIR